MRKEAKNGFPNVALEGVDKRRPNLVSKREKTVERERGEEKREEEEEEEEKKKRRRREAMIQKGMELHGLLNL